MYSLSKKVTGSSSGVPNERTHNKQQRTDELALDQLDMLCKKFEDLALLIAKSKPKQSIQDVIRHKCRKPRHYASQCQMQTESLKSCSYYGRYGHSEAACYKKQADKATVRNRSQNTQKVQILKKEVATSVDQKEKSVMYFQEEVSEHEGDKVLMKRFATGDPVQKQIRFEEYLPQVEDQNQVLGAARVRRRTIFTTKERPQKKTYGTKKKDTRQKSGIQALGERTERYDLRNSLATAPAGITFEQIATGDVDKFRKELHKIIAKKVTRSSVNVTGEVN